MQQIVDIPVSGGGLQDFRPGQGSSSSSHVPARGHEDADGPGEGFFAVFPNIKKVRSWVRTRSLVVAVSALPTFDVTVPQTVDQLVEAPSRVSLVEVFSAAR